ncbi:hypothetical protein EON65_23855 [archaeon]|nr:MAG: hypothetical protein EON65_23855 [archaeon]
MVPIAVILAGAVLISQLFSTQCALYLYPNVDLLAGKSTMSCIYALHKTSSAYNAPTIRIRRSSDNAQLDFYANPDGDMNSDLNGAGTLLATWLGGSTAYVTIWYDQTGNGRHATQTTTSLQPTYVVSSKTVSFDTTDDFMYAHANCVNYGNAAYTTVVRQGSIGNTANGGHYGFGSPNSGETVSCRAYSGTQYRVGFGFGTSSTYADFGSGGSYSTRTLLKSI